MKKWISRILITLVVFVIAFALFYKFWFLRLPERNIPHNNTAFVSPCNGVVVSINKWDAQSVGVVKGDYGFIKVWTTDVDTAGMIVSIQMNPTHVHYQRAPQEGTVIAKKYTKGSFNNAIVMSNNYGIRFENEHNEMLFETASGKRYKVIQIAGFLARRIEDYIQPQQKVKQGDIIGLIKLGSQITVILPKGVKVDAKIGQTVIDGESIIATEE